jgi:hypothetical protein
LVKKAQIQRTNRQLQITSTTDNPLKSGTFYKIKVDKSGIFKITTKFLKDNGINPSNINPKNFRIYGNGGIMLPEFNRDFWYSSLQEDAIQVIGEEDGKWDDADYALFYAQGPHGYNLFDLQNGNGHKRKDTRLTHKSQNFINIYEDNSYYFINFDIGAGKRVATSDITPPSNYYTRYDDYQYLNEEKINFLNIGRLWVGDAFNTNKSIVFNTRSPIQLSDNIKVKTAIFAQNTNNDKITYSINGQKSTSYTVTNTSNTKIIELPWELTENQFTGNVIKLDYTINSSNPLAAFYFDYAEVQYKEDLKYNDSQMNFRVFEIPEGNGLLYGFKIDNIGNLEQVWDVSDMTNAKKVVNKSSGGEFSFGYLANSNVFRVDCEITFCCQTVG